MATNGVSSMASAANDALHISTGSGKPIREICDTLGKAYHWRISYEEPPAFQRDVVTEA